MRTQLSVLRVHGVPARRVCDQGMYAFRDGKGRLTCRGNSMSLYIWNISLYLYAPSWAYFTSTGCLRGMCVIRFEMEKGRVCDTGPGRGNTTY